MTERDKRQLAILVILLSGLVGGFFWGVETTPKIAPFRSASLSRSPSSVVSKATPSAPRFVPPEDRLPSALRAYEQVADSIDRKIGNANAIEVCGLRKGDWYEQVVEGLENYRNGPQVAPLLMALTPDELREARIFDMRVAKETTKWELPHGLTGCRKLASMPFVYNDAAFLP